MFDRKDWATCEKCQKYYLHSMDAILDRKEIPLFCPQGHVMTWHPQSIASQRIEAIYLLLSSLYITMPEVVSFKQYHFAYEMIQKLKELENE